MKNLNLELAIISFLCVFCNFSYGQTWKDSSNAPENASNNGEIVTTFGPKALPAVIKSLVSNADGLQLKFTTSDKELMQILIYRKDMEDGNFIFVKSVIPNNRTLTYTYTDNNSNLKQGRQYCYLIRTRIKGQGIGTHSKGKPTCRFFDSEINPGPRPKNPEELKVLEVTSNSVTVSFKDRSSNEKYFLLERKEPHHSEWKVTSVKQRPKRDRGISKEVKIKNISLEMEQRYYYRARAVNNNGSSLSNTIGVDTYPLDVGIGTVKITHPSKNILQIAWKYDKTDKPDWEVTLYDIDNDQNPIRTNQINGNHKRMTSFNNLDPTKQYCIIIRGASASYYSKVCDSPFAKRTLENQTGPIVPSIISVERVSDSELKVNLKNGREGQLVDLVKMENGQRKTLTSYRNGRETLGLVGLGAGKKYCIRMFTNNTYGTRYSSTKCQATILNPPNKPYVTTISNDHVIMVKWTSFGADEHTFNFSGKKQGATDHVGTIKLDPPYDYKEFQAKPNYSYCFKVKSKNDYDVTDWSPSLCGVISNQSEVGEEIISFASFLVAEIPPSGNIIYLGQLAPGNNSRLQKVYVAGNNFTPYIVQFLPQGKTREDCGSNVGVFIEPGSNLEGNDLVTLYESSEPKTPVFFGACKLARPNKTINTSRIPIQIDYVKE